jgi:hypothetical protein
MIQDLHLILALSEPESARYASSLTELAERFDLPATILDFGGARDALSCTEAIPYRMSAFDIIIIPASSNLSSDSGLEHPY